MKWFVFVLVVVSLSNCQASSYELLAAYAWAAETDSVYPDFSASLTADQRPSIFQYFYKGAPTLFSCSSRDCLEISTLKMPGLNEAQFALGGVSPRRIQQYSPVANGAQYFLSKGYTTPNRDVEIVLCLPSDPQCDKPIIRNTVDSPGFGAAGLRLTFTREGLPMMIIPQARYASADNRVTGYTIQSCQDVLCENGFYMSTTSLPFNLTGKAYCQGTSVDVALNQFGFPTWLTLCGSELNLIHCLTQTCNQTSVVQFAVDRNLVYFVYLAVDSRFRFSIATSGQTAQSDITYIRCLDADCSQSIQSQLTLPSKANRRLVGTRVQFVINPKTDLPIFHFTATEYPSDIPVYQFIPCTNVECSDLSETIDYGVRLGFNQLRVSEMLVDNQGIVIAASRVNNAITNQTLNVFVRIAQRH